MKRTKRKNFFTLLEVMISMGVFTVLMLALMQFFTTAQDVWDRSGSKTELYDTGRLAMQLLQDDLVSAFYGDEYHDTTANPFFKLENNTKLTFAAMRQEGLTALHYEWNVADMTLTLAEKEQAGATSITRSSSWMTDVQGQPKNVILDNVLYFNVVAKDHEDNDISASAQRPPAMLLITMAVLEPTAYEQVKKILTAEDSSTDAAAIATKITTFFNGMLEGIKLKDRDSALTGSGTDRVMQEHIYDGVQFFQKLVMIER